MGKIELLDCTLRDGGYINNWNFTSQSILEVIIKLQKSGIKSIECGYLDFSQKKKIQLDFLLLKHLRNCYMKIICPWEKIGANYT